MHPLITVIGNVGSGKSTIAPVLADSLSADYVAADELFKVNPFFPLALQDRARWSLASDLWFLKERIGMLENYIQNLHKKNVVVDSGLWMSLAYAASRKNSGYFTLEEWNLYQDLYQNLTHGLVADEIIVHFKASVDFLRERICSRGREFEIMHHTREYLTGLEYGIEFVKGELDKQKTTVIEIDVEKQNLLTDESLKQEILAQIRGVYA